MTRQTASWIAVALLVLAGASHAQTHKDSRYGFQVKPPKGFAGVAVSPGESYVVAKFANENKDYGKSWGSGTAAQFAVSIFPGARGEETSQEAIDNMWRRLETYAGLEEKTKKIKIARQPALERYYSNEGSNAGVYYAVLPQDDGFFVFEGRALLDRFDKYARDFSKAAKSFKRIDKVDRSAELAQMTEQERFIAEQIDRLPEGWSSLRTERYVFLYNAEKKFVEELGEQIEAIRDVYEEIWVPDEPIEASTAVTMLGTPISSSVCSM